MSKIHASALEGRSFCFICEHSRFVGNAYMVCRYNNDEFGDVEDPDDCDDYDPGDGDDDEY